MPLETIDMNIGRPLIIQYPQIHQVVNKESITAATIIAGGRFSSTALQSVVHECHTDSYS